MLVIPTNRPGSHDSGCSLFEGIFQFWGKHGLSEERVSAIFVLVNVLLVTYVKGWPGDGRGDGKRLAEHHQGILRIS